MDVERPLDSFTLPATRVIFTLAVFLGLAAILPFTLAVPTIAGATASPRLQASTPAPRFSVAKAHRCGIVSIRMDARSAVYIVRGRVGCTRARAVIRYVGTHGVATQGSPGRAPRGWSCGWGYENDRQGNIRRSGPSCKRGRVRVQGTTPGLRPAS